MKRISVSTEPEKLIAIGSIVSTRFMKKIRDVAKPEYFKSDYAKIVFEWALEYFNRYKRVPDKTIEQIYRINSESIDEDQRRLIFVFLSKTSRMYSSGRFNEEYAIDVARKFFADRTVEDHFEKGMGMVDAGRIADARNLIDNFKKISDTSGSGPFNPFEKRRIMSFQDDRRANQIFSVGGALGKYLGPFEKTWLVSFQAPEKRKKSWMLMELAFHAIKSRVKTVIFSLEMNEQMLMERIYRRLMGYPDYTTIREVGERGFIKYPVFDCMKNQLDKCVLKERVGKGRLRTSEKAPFPEYSPKLRYRPCSVCRGKTQYQHTYWFDYISKEGLKQWSMGDVWETSRELMDAYGDVFRVQSFPAFSANFDDVERSLDSLESDGFIPELIVIDYFDIMANEQRRGFDQRATINLTWMRGKNLADTRHCCVITADQSRRDAREKRHVSDMDTGEDKRKDAHVDMKCAINQTPEEHDDNVLRVALMLHRHRRIYKRMEIMVLQALEIGQPLIDSAYWPVKKF